MRRVKKKDLVEGGFYFCPLSKRTVQVTQKTFTESEEPIVHIRIFDDIYKTLTLKHDLFEGLTRLEKFIYRHAV